MARHYFLIFLATDSTVAREISGWIA